MTPSVLFFGNMWSFQRVVVYNLSEKEHRFSTWTVWLSLLQRPEVDGVSHLLLCSASSSFSICSCFVVTWLILPVVICLSQRLSHACLSISSLYYETADGSLKQSQSIRWFYYSDNRSNSRANTCTNLTLCVGVFIRSNANMSSDIPVNHSNFSDRRKPTDRSNFCPISFRW